MAEDDKDPKIGASEEDNKGSDDGHRELFIDRDDDSSPPLVDSDYGDGFPGSGDEPEDIDPGYAAFASELEDPLADWPSPDVPLNDLPEVRQHKEAADRKAAAQDFEPESDSQSSNHEPDDEVLLSFSSSETVFDDTNDHVDTRAPDLVDVDHLSGTNSDDSLNVMDGCESPEAVMPDKPLVQVFTEESPTVATYHEPDLPTNDFTPDDESFEEPLPEQNEAFDEPPRDFEEEFVDDFLNDLDPPEEEELPAVDDFEDGFDTSVATTAGFAASSVERAATYDDPSMSGLDSEAVQSPTGGPSQNSAQDKENRAFPLGMIAVVGVALILLGIGGYGVMQQRGDMQAEIRELQAKLATTISPEEAEMERERQRQVQLQNESLNTELEALTAENDALAQQLAELEAAQAAKVTAAAQQRAEEAAAAKAAAAAKQAAAIKQAAAQSSTASKASGSTPKGPWFVNFGSYADRTIAERWAKKLTVDNGEVVVQTATAASKTLYRVRVIGLASQDSAERVATALERQYQLPRLWVGKN